MTECGFKNTELYARARRRSDLASRSSQESTCSGKVNAVRAASEEGAGASLETLVRTNVPAYLLDVARLVHTRDFGLGDISDLRSNASYGKTQVFEALVDARNAGWCLCTSHASGLDRRQPDMRSHPNSRPRTGVVTAGTFV